MSQYKNPDNDPRGDWSSANMVGLLPEDQRPNCHYDLINPDSDINYGKPKMGWRYDKNTMNQLIKENKIIWPTSIDGRPRRKKFLNELQQEYTGYSSIVGADVYTRHGTIEIEDLFKFKAFDFPKPTALLKDLLIQGMGEEKSALFMDFFAGSGSSFDALMQINKENNTSHRYIAIQLPESVDNNSPSGLNGFKDIAGISAKRIALADKKYNGSSMVGFKYLKLSDSNINRWEPEFDSLSDILDSSVDSIKSERDSDDVLYEVLLKYGLDLTYPITEHTLAGKIVYDVAFGSLIVCLDDGITRDVVEGIGKLKQELDSETTRVVFKDAGFADDSVKVNAIQMLKQYGVDDVKSI